MPGSIYLIGGGEISQGETELIDLSIKSKAPARSEMLFFPTAAFDNEDYCNTIVSIFGDHFNVTSITEKNSRDEILEAINRSSVVYIGGGHTNRLMDTFQKWNITDALREAWQSGLTIAGMSAGAYALSSKYIDSDDNFLIKNGWGFVNLVSLVHADKDKSLKAYESYTQTSAIAGDFFGIGEKAALLWENEEIKKIGSGEIWHMSAELDKLTRL